jgi:hypothetical protein
MSAVADAPEDLLLRPWLTAVCRLDRAADRWAALDARGELARSEHADMLIAAWEYRQAAGAYRERGLSEPGDVPDVCRELYDAARRDDRAALETAARALHALRASE